MIMIHKITHKEDELIRALKLRPEDAQELTTAHKVQDPTEALRKTLVNSDWAEVVRDTQTGEPYAMFGVKQVPMARGGRDCGLVWMVGSDAIQRHKKLFTRYCYVMLKKLFEDFDCLCNWVDSRNDVHIHWLRRMGFQFDPKQDTWINGVTFRFFYKYKEVRWFQ
jgi:hypothetical protein